MRALAAIAAGVMFATSVQAAPVTLDPDQMRQVGFVALTSDQPGKALEISAALLRRDPQDVSALILKSRALRDLGHYTDARATAAQAWAGARTEAQRYGAALAMAQALASEGARTRAQFWLRRAVQASPTPLARQIAERDFDYVRARNPLSFSLQVSLAPSSNINGGSSNTATELLGLPFLLSGDARALSGTEATLGLTLRWRLPVTPTAQTEYRLSVLDRHYWLSSEARRQAPEATGGDYDYAAVELGWSRRITPQTGPLNYSLGAALGRNWYGHSPLSVYLRAEAAVDGPLTPRTAWQLQAYSEQQWRDDAARNSARILGAIGRDHTRTGRWRANRPGAGRKRHGVQGDLDRPPRRVGPDRLEPGPSRRRHRAGGRSGG